jgi:hypothetical protein
MMHYKCSCQNIFCIKCRIPELHNCTFDFQEEYKKQLTKNNPVVRGQKVDKI